MSAAEGRLDRREEFKHLVWRQGSVETMAGYAQLKRMPPEFIAEATESVRCLALADVWPRRIEVRVCRYSSAEECAAAVAAHNEALRAGASSRQDREA